MSIPDHIILFTFLLIFFFVWGVRSYDIKNNEKFWLTALWPIITYSIILGCRYGWGNDYKWYKFQFEHTTNTYVVETTQLWWREFNHFLSDGFLGLNYVGAFIVYSLIYIVSAFVLIRGYGRESKYMYAFLLPATLMLSTFTIRQSVAFSFVFLAISFANKKDWIKMIIVIIISASIHSSSLISVVWIAFFYLFVRYPISWKVTIPIYLFFTFVWDVSQLGFINNYIQFLNLGNSNFQSYIDNSDEWFSAEAVQDQYLQSTLTQILSAIFHVTSIFFCYQSLKRNGTNRSIISLYNVIVTAIIVSRAGFSIELVRRIGDTMFSLYFIPLGFCWYHYNIKGMKLLHKEYRIVMNVCVYSIIFFLIAYFGRWILFFDDLNSKLHLKSMFIWNL